jgi:hypothetical protein
MSDLSLRSRSSRKRRTRRLAADARGAVIVEFAIAIMPMLIFFFGIFQWCTCAYAHLLLKHAAFVAARAEAVIHPGMSDSGAATDPTKAAKLIFAVTKAAKNIKVSFPGQPNENSQEMLEAQVEMDFQCQIPLGNVVACGNKKKMHMTAKASFPNQGSMYQRVWGNGTNEDDSSGGDDGSEGD